MSSEVEPVLRRSKREHQPSAKAAASSAPLPPTSSSSRRSQRRRVTHSASPASTPASTRNSSPVRGFVTSPASSDLVSVVVDAVGPTGQRRRLRAAAHTSATHGVHSTYPSGVHDDNKVLGRYSGRDCALLCEVILKQLKKQTLAPTVLDEAKSPAFIRWEPVAKKMETTHKIPVTARECQVLWKFLAYGEIPVETDELLPDSDEEDFHKTPKEINAQVAATRAQEKEKDKSQVVAADETSKVQGEQVSGAQGEEAKSSERDEKDEADTGTEQEKTQADDTQKESEPLVRLYPTYSLPAGAPDAWYRPFGPKDAMPLTFVASRFLRRKPIPPTQSLLGKSTVLAPSTADLKRQAAPANNVAAAKKPKMATPPVSTPPHVFTPSSTPPAAAKRARSELEFFELRLREEHARKTPGSKFELSVADIQRRYGEASAQVRRECQTLAAHDVERFNREVVRVRIWEKAMGISNVTPKPTLAPPPTPKPAALPSSASSTKPMSTVPTGTTAASSANVPVVKKSSGPTAALLAHAAAVAATAANHKSSSGMPANTSSTTKTVQEQKDGEAAIAKPADK